MQAWHAADPGWPKTTLDEVVELIRQAHGFDLFPFNQTFLAQSLDKRVAATSTETPGAYVEYLECDYGEAEALLHSLRIVYSEFFRDPLAFALLEQSILPRLLCAEETAGRGEIRVWSAGCAAGQEAWSVAILLDELIRALDKPFTYRIFATDLSAPDLALARTGVYSAAAVGNVRSRHLGEYFTRHGDSFAVVPRLRERVDFSVYDLLDASTICPPTSIFGDFDLVLCSNVLFYYRPELSRFILNKVQRCLAPDGYLITGEAERQIVTGAGGFCTVVPAATVFQQMRNRR